MIPGVVYTANIEEPYRYWLTRTWRGTARANYMAFCMLNPSTADEMTDDPTILKCMAMAKAHGCNGIWVVNLFAYRATDPKKLLDSMHRVGRQFVVGAVLEAGKDGETANDIYILDAAKSKYVNHFVCAWGVSGGDKIMWRVREVEKLLRRYEPSRPIMCLGTTKGKQPKHPLYLPTLTKIAPWPGSTV